MIGMKECERHGCYNFHFCQHCEDEKQMGFCGFCNAYGHTFNSCRVIKAQIKRDEEKSMTRDLERYQKQVLEEAIKLKASHPEWDDNEFRNVLQRLGIWGYYIATQFKDNYPEGTVLRIRDRGYLLWGMKLQVEDMWIWGRSLKVDGQGGTFLTMIKYFNNNLKENIIPQDLIATKLN